MELALPAWWCMWMYSLHTPTIQFKSSSLFLGVDFHNDMVFPMEKYFFLKTMWKMCAVIGLELRRGERAIEQIAECYNDLKQPQQQLPCT